MFVSNNGRLYRRWTNVRRFRSKPGDERCLFKAFCEEKREDCVIKFVPELDVKPLEAWEAEGLMPPQILEARVRRRQLITVPAPFIICLLLRNRVM